MTSINPNSFDTANLSDFKIPLYSSLPDCVIIIFGEITICISCKKAEE